MALSTQFSKVLYQKFCEEQGGDLPIFYMPWWLDGVCALGEWLGLVVLEENEVLAVQPFYIVKKYGLSIVTSPPLTMFNGLWIKNLEGLKDVNKSKKETKIILEAISALPKTISFYTQNYHYSFKNWLPYFWKKYSQTTRYSFIIHDLAQYSIDLLAANIRNKINKASQTLQANTCDKPKEVYQMWSDSLTQAGVKVPLTEIQFLALDQSLMLHGQRKIITARDHNGVIHGYNYLVHDATSVYNLILAHDVKKSESGTSAFLLHHSILSYKTSGKVFDFEGSMLEKMNDLFTGFGGEQTSYFRILKAKNVWIDLAFRVKDRFSSSIR